MDGRIVSCFSMTEPQAGADPKEFVCAAWREGEELALHPRMQSITLEVILRAVFGVTDPQRRAQLSERLPALLDGATSVGLQLRMVLAPRLLQVLRTEAPHVDLAIKPVTRIDLAEPFRVDVLGAVQQRRRRERHDGDADAQSPLQQLSSVRHPCLPSRSESRIRGMILGNRETTLIHKRPGVSTAPRRPRADRVP